MLLLFFLFLSFWAAPQHPSPPSSNATPFFHNLSPLPRPPNSSPVVIVDFSDSLWLFYLFMSLAFCLFWGFSYKNWSASASVCPSHIAPPPPRRCCPTQWPLHPFATELLSLHKNKIKFPTDQKCWPVGFFFDLQVWLFFLEGNKYLWIIKKNNNN